MAIFQIETSIGALTYNTDPCTLTHADGTRVDLSRLHMPYVDAASTDNDGHDFSPQKPIVGKDQPRILKIQLGLGCNYTCTYCSQGGQKEEATSSSDAIGFIAGLDAWLKEAPDKIEFWGGEPMLYWKKLEILIPALREKFQDAHFSIVTNGSLLDLRKARFLYRHGFSMAISHDGPGQSLRGEDPFENPEWVQMVKSVFRLFGERITFNAVITPKNYRLLDTLMWFEQRMGFEVRVNIEDIVTDYGGIRWAEKELGEMEEEIFKAVSSGIGFLFPRLRWSFVQLLESLSIAKPLDGSHQVCGMDRKDQLAVDLNGNVLTCQNSGVKSGHKIGSVSNLAEVSLDTSFSWASRPNCRQCPVVHLCYGSCMFISGEDFNSSCETSFRYNRAILSAFVKVLTGADVYSISGWRPERKPVFPIKVVGI